MSYREAIAQVITIVEAVSSYDDVHLRSELRRGAPPKFRHFADASDLKLPTARGFWLRADSHAMRGPLTPGLPTRLASEVTLSIAYRASADPSVLDEIIAFDYRAVASAVLDPAKWARPSSTIIAIWTEGALLAPASITDLDGARVLRIPLTMEFVQ